MSAPTPGPGWTEVPNAVDVPDGAELLTWAPPSPDAVRYWILVPPKPLPTDVGTVIRGSSGAAEGLWILDDAGWHRAGDMSLVPADVLQDRIGGFETVSADPASTASAVLADVVSRGITTADDTALTAIAQHYGANTPQA